ncbi:entry exclusion protein TrbK [Agrobacterium tumefaciens]|uniref:entry exclusion protein TrbK n=1 Tax=Agrobacterium tumefaciens TaxID=358 RepID=UPI001574C131|nr:entry exclusion protein TrbK [Agrobacterium tumefaciens]WCK69460.1 entry exclusion protein TrbK [Agrobacterium tumefaciens]
MSPRILIALVVAGGIGLGGGFLVWLIVQPGTTTATSTVTSGSGEARRESRERFFSGDPDRDVRGGQEMKPRW